MSEPLLLPLGKKTKRPYRGNNAFGILGVSPRASMKVVKRAYLRLASQYHPDKNPSHEARQQFIKINQAYNFIVKGGDIARYLVLCDITQLKQKFAEALMNIKRTGILTGIDLEMPRSPLSRTGMSDDEWNQQQKLLIGLMFRCPHCKWGKGCDIATGFSEVEDIYKRMVKESRRRVFDSLFKGS